jgi:hypothetical protein
MARTQGSYFSIDTARLENIASLAPMTFEQAKDICLDSDWAEGDAHQEWLDTAPEQEIANWAFGILND